MSMLSSRFIARVPRFITKNIEAHIHAQKEFSNCLTPFREAFQSNYISGCREAARDWPNGQLAKSAILEALQADEFAMRSLQLKAKKPLLPGFRYDHYAQVTSQATAGFQYSAVTLRMPARGQMPMPNYVEKVAGTALNFTSALAKRSRHVSPEMAVRYTAEEQPEAAFKRYTDYVSHMESQPVQEMLQKLNITAPREIGNSLRNQADRSNIFQTNMFVQGDQSLCLQVWTERTGSLGKKLSKNGLNTIEEHIDEGFTLAERTKAALERSAKKGLDDYVSAKMLRNNPFSSRLSTQGLSRYEEATQYLLNHEIASDLQHIAFSGTGIEFKILRDGTARVIQRNKQGQILSNQTFKGDTVQAGIDGAIDHATDLLLDPELPQLSKTRRFLLNPIHEVKRNVQHNVDRLAEGKWFQAKTKSQIKAAPDMDEAAKQSWMPRIPMWEARINRLKQTIHTNRTDSTQLAAS